MSSRYFEGETHAVVYAKFRPTTPPSLSQKILNFLQEKNSGPFHIAVDVGCGSGQSTKCLSEHFKSVVGLDISEAQIEEAIKENSFSNITYRVSPAETLSFEDESVQLVTAGQACHYFDLPKFYEEVKRILSPNGVLALYCNSFPHLIWQDKSEELTKYMMKIHDAVEKYWAKEVEYVYKSYTHDIFKMPFEDMTRDDSLTNEIEASVQDVAGYVSTWSGFQGYRKADGDAAANKLLNEFKENVMKTIGTQQSMEETKVTLSFPFFILLGRKGGSPAS